MKHKLSNMIFSILMIAALLISASNSVSAKPLAMPMSPVDESKVPHYFGPYPN